MNREAVSHLYVVVHDSTRVSKVWVLGVDVSQLYGNQVMNLEQVRLIVRRTYWRAKMRVIFLRQAGLTISLVMGSLFLRSDVTTSTMASWSLGNRRSS